MDSVKTKRQSSGLQFQLRRPTICLLLVTLGSGVAGFYLGRNVFPSTAQRAEGVVSADGASVGLTTKPTLEFSEAIVQRRVPSATGAWEDQWKALMTQPRTHLRDDRVIVALEDLATRDANRALSLARAEVHLPLRLELLRSALRGWAKSDPDAAGDWALSHQSIIDKCDAVSAILTGAINDPDVAIRLFWHFSETDPGNKRNFGNSLIAALSNNGDFSRAAVFAAQGDAQYRAEWLTAAFSSWSGYQPQIAVGEAAKLEDPDSRQTAVQAALVGWAQSDPQGLAEYAITMPDGPDKSVALTESLSSWAVNDPAAAAGWINQIPSAPELDQGIATVARAFDTKPEVAVTWAESIADIQLRSSTLANVVRRWTELDPVAARQYAETSADIVGEDRLNLLIGFGDSN
jgi:hypothetical protein